MAEQEFLTEERFNRFEDKFDTFCAELGKRDLRVEGRLTALETNQSNAGWIATWLSGIIATIVTAVVLAFGKVFGQQ